MTEQMAKQIKKILKKENVNVKSFYFDKYTDETKSTLRVKVTEYIERGYYLDRGVAKLVSMEQRKKETQDVIIKVLMTLSNNGLRPEYKTEQRTNTNNYGTFDCRYIIFK
jgi:hypothetical protein